jgi:hypothetical protein
MMTMTGISFKMDLIAMIFFMLHEACRDIWVIWF